MDTDDPQDSAPRFPGPGPLVLRIFLGLFGMPFLSFGFLVVAGGLVSVVTGDSIAASLFGTIFGLPFLAVGGFLVWVAVRGTGGLPERLRKRAGHRLDRFQRHVESAAERAGAGAVQGALSRHRTEPPPRKRSTAPTAATRSPGSRSFARCPECGAGLTDSTLISPSGDVRCDHCRTWFKVER